ncbi:MBL fold metallo-hydrolase [Altericista sp. CCNU0014]|uniref:MBL fold metallo-hydrolase n=1 Tax=Altericista sp. CCNU0014 TaxID=3082949 RepID=UPI00385076D1
MSKEPRPVLNSVWAFPPNRDTLGGTAYLIVENPQNIPQNILIDCPSWDDRTRAFLEQNGGVRWLVLTHRQGMSSAAASIQERFGCQVLVQEQEAYLLPDVKISTFSERLAITPSTQVFWTPGYSPGSACVYYRPEGILFSGRHLLPDASGSPQPLRTAKTFHWPRQLDRVRQILERFDDDSLRYLCPGANTGFLRQARSIDRAYAKLQQLDLLALRHAAVWI